ncbi:PepSY-associated TM helix domain-containing protein [Gayadomonas joobiniege]|uniref:PepSY-associated TM helix domain-containing protein n=1 Tax=Gayadomonas joobiniege TaxID=1234606 RepID=UPI000374E2BD|nr:PepSY-associated TM helix domain-containing protein [Gayadomonas joobiniege]
MSFSISPSVNKSALKSHAWIGLAVSVLMYWVCFSGTLSVFSQELLRWEQPHIMDDLSYTPSSIQTAYERFFAMKDGTTEGNIVLRLPTQDLPRARISADGEAWNISPTGELSEPSNAPITDLIVDLHTALHLPEDIGMILVSMLGAILSALIISGLIAHRRIFKDAFRLRTGNNEQLTQGDLHNRMSVWGLPFHLMIALTGVYFGLASFLTSVYADAIYDGKKLDLFADIYGSSIQVEHQPKVANMARALSEIRRMEPNTQPVFITLENATKDNQYILLGSQHLDKLIYSEQYRFDSHGNYIDKVGYSDGEAGQQAIFSVYRIHFGHFGPEAMKIFFGLMGFALTIISVTGINLWLAKRQKQDALNQLWVGFVWGTPIAFICAALFQFILAIPTKAVFWLALLVILSGVLSQKNLLKTHLFLLNLLAVLLIALPTTHFVVHYPDALVPNSIAINTAFIVFALCVWRYRYSRVRKGWDRQ